jgi:hypothetical protein
MLDLLEREKASLEQVILTRSGFARSQMEHMDNPQMDSANLAGVIVNQSHNLILATALDDHLLG